ncbi:MAG: flavodoxin family protein [Planctomycetota bacterium]|jgi:NAD(P)H dehydrogenase (quinone)
MSKKVLVLYDSNHKIIEKMATVIASGVREAGLDGIVESCESASVEDFKNYDGIIIGSPCYFAGPSAKVKKLIDSSYGLKGDLEGKVGAAFTTSEHIGGGNELTLRAIIDSFLIHGMVVQGDPDADHFGAVVVSSGDESITDTSGECRRLGLRVANLINRLAE